MVVRHKFNAKRCEKDGRKFSSLGEGRYYEHLKAEQAAGRVVFFLMQVPFHLPGNLTYRADFVAFMADGTVRVIDYKGMSTPTFIMKRKLLEETYPFELEIVSSK